MCLLRLDPDPPESGIAYKLMRITSEPNVYSQYWTFFKKMVAVEQINEILFLEFITPNLFSIRSVENTPLNTKGRQYVKA